MNDIARMMSEGGIYTYGVVFLSAIGAFPLSIAALIVSMVSKKRRPGILLGYVSLGLSLAMFAWGLFGYMIGVDQVEAALGAAAPGHILAAAAKGVSMALSSVALALLLGGLPFFLSVLAISRSGVRSRTLPPEPVDTPVAVAGGGAAILAAILPSVLFIVAIVTLFFQRSGISDFVDALEYGGVGSLGVVFFTIVSIVLLSILGPKAVRGQKILVAPLLMLGGVPWLSSFCGQLWAAMEGYGALESAAPDQRVAAMARGIAIPLELSTLCSTISGWLLLALGFSLAMGARGRRAPDRKGSQIIIGGLAALPLLAMAAVAVASLRAPAGILLLGSLVAVATIALGASGIGNDPQHRTFSLGVGAALAAGLGFVSLSVATSSNITQQTFSVLEAVAPEFRAQTLAEAARAFGTIFVIRDFGWIAALLPALVVAIVSIKWSRPGKGRLAGAVFATFIFVLGPFLMLMTSSVLGLPDWIQSSSPWLVQPSFLPSVTTSVACESGRGYGDFYAVIGLQQTTMVKAPPYDTTPEQRRMTGGYAYENIAYPADPAVMGQLTAKFKAGLEYKPEDRLGGLLLPQELKANHGGKGKRHKADDGHYGIRSPRQNAKMAEVSAHLSAHNPKPGPPLHLAIDHRLSAGQFKQVVRAAQAAGAGSIAFMGTETPFVPVDPAPLEKLHPLLKSYAIIFAGETCILSVPIGPIPISDRHKTVWEGKVGSINEMPLTVRSIGDTADASDRNSLSIPNRSDVYGLDFEEQSDKSNKFLLITPDDSTTAGKLILAAASAKAKNYSPLFSDPSLIPIRKEPVAKPEDRAVVEQTGELGLNNGVAPKNISVKQGKAMVQGRLSEKTVQRITKRHLNEVKFCYERQLAKTPNLSGRVAIKYIISGVGDVQMSAVASSTLGNADVENCIAKAVRRWTFPQPEGGGVVIATSPFILAAPKD